jgi:cyclic pyranopterin phosphate synthase
LDLASRAQRETIAPLSRVDERSTFEQFAFEEPNSALAVLPLAARRALDAAGVRLSLEAWRGLSLDERRALIAAGAGPQVDFASVERLAERARPVPERVAPAADPEQIVAELAVAAGARRAELERAWPELTPLKRYALVKLARSKKTEAAERRARLERAFDELLPRSAPNLTHLTPEGEAHMVDVSQKQATPRRAVARGFVAMKPETLAALKAGNTPKGDVLAVARIAGIQAAKRTPELIPLCHAVQLTGVEVELVPSAEPAGVSVTATARAFDRTGVEMEALVAVSAAALTLYDMLKAVDRGMRITNVELVAKSGGRSGDFRREEG